MLEWNYIKPYNPEDIAAYETQTGFVFPDFYKRCLPSINGGFPSETLFTVDNRHVHSFMRIFPVQKDIRDSIWNYEYLFISNGRKYMPFANDRSGNILCFENGENKDMSVYIYDHDDKSYVFVSYSFAEFLLSLYSETTANNQNDRRLPYPYKLINAIKDAYKEKYGCYPIEDGFDLTVDSLEYMLQEYISSDDRNVLCLRYEEDKTLEYIGGIYHVTRERIRQKINHIIENLGDKCCLRKYSPVDVKCYDSLQKKYNELENAIADIKDYLSTMTELSFLPQDSTAVMLQKMNALAKCIENRRIQNCNLSKRAKNALCREGYTDIYSIINEIDTEKKLKSIRNFGKSCEKELLNYLHSIGLKMKWES